MNQDRPTVSWQTAPARWLEELGWGWSGLKEVRDVYKSVRRKIFNRDYIYPFVGSRGFIFTPEGQCRRCRCSALTNWATKSHSWEQVNLLGSCWAQHRTSYVGLNTALHISHFFHKTEDAHSCLTLGFHLTSRRPCCCEEQSRKSLLGIWFYYYAKLERHFAILWYTNLAVSSREWKPRIAMKVHKADKGFPEGWIRGTRYREGEFQTFSDFPVSSPSHQTDLEGINHIVTLRIAIAECFSLCFFFFQNLAKSQSKSMASPGSVMESTS